MQGLFIICRGLASLIGRNILSLAKPGLKLDMCTALRWIHLSQRCILWGRVYHVKQWISGFPGNDIGQPPNMGSRQAANNVPSLSLAYTTTMQIAVFSFLHGDHIAEFHLVIYSAFDPVTPLISPCQLTLARAEYFHVLPCHFSGNNLHL